MDQHIEYDGCAYIYTLVGVVTGFAGGVGVDDWIGFDDVVLWLLASVAAAAAAAAAFCSSACCCNFARRFNRIYRVVNPIRAVFRVLVIFCLLPCQHQKVQRCP